MPRGGPARMNLIITGNGGLIDFSAEGFKMRDIPSRGDRSRQLIIAARWENSAILGEFSYYRECTRKKLPPEVP